MPRKPKSISESVLDSLRSKTRKPRKTIKARASKDLATKFVTGMKKFLEPPY